MEYIFVIATLFLFLYPGAYLMVLNDQMDAHIASRMPGEKIAPITFFSRETAVCAIRKFFFLAVVCILAFAYFEVTQ